MSLGVVFYSDSYGSKVLSLSKNANDVRNKNPLILTINGLLGQSFMLEEKSYLKEPIFKKNAFAFLLGVGLKKAITKNEFGEGFYVEIGVQYGEQKGWGIYDYHYNGVDFELIDHEHLRLAALVLNPSYRLNAKNQTCVIGASIGAKHILTTKNQYYSFEYKKTMPYVGLAIDYVIPKFKNMQSIGIEAQHTFQNDYGRNSRHFSYYFIRLKISLYKK
jgi:hypothetical protein